MRCLALVYFEKKVSYTVKGNSVIEISLVYFSFQRVHAAPVMSVDEVFNFIDMYSLYLLREDRLRDVFSRNIFVYG